MDQCKRGETLCRYDYKDGRGSEEDGSEPDEAVVERIVNKDREMGRRGDGRRRVKENETHLPAPSSVYE